MGIPKGYEAVIEKIKESLYPWRKLTIAFDGADNAGKSSIARYSSWKTQAPLIETDFLIIKETSPFKYRYDRITELVKSRHEMNRPVLIEGIKILETLERINVVPDILIFVENLDFSGSDDLGKEINEYNEKYQPKGKADHVYSWTENS
jgi:hypothetical protein